MGRTRTVPAQRCRKGAVQNDMMEQSEKRMGSLYRVNKKGCVFKFTASIPSTINDRRQEVIILFKTKG